MTPKLPRTKPSVGRSNTQTSWQRRCLAFKYERREELFDIPTTLNMSLTPTLELLWRSQIPDYVEICSFEKKIR